MKKILKNLKIHFFIAFFSLFSALNFNVLFCLSLEYSSFVRGRVDVFRQFRHHTFEERLIKLLSLCEYDVSKKEFFININSIPLKNDKTQATLKFKINELDELSPSEIFNFLSNPKNIFKCRVYLFDMNNEECLKGIFKRNQNGEHSGELCAIEVNPQYSEAPSISFRGNKRFKTEFKISGKKRLIGGTLILDLWDRLCKLLAPGNVKLLDVSRVRDLDLRLIRPFTHTDRLTWYGKKGYQPAVNKEEYKKSIDYIWNLSLEKLKEDFADNQQMVKIFKKYIGLLNRMKLFLNFDGLETFGGLLSHIFACYEKASDEDKEAFYEDLKVVYQNCLERYNSASSSDYKIFTALRLINVVEFEKNYSA